MCTEKLCEHSCYVSKHVSKKAGCASTPIPCAVANRHLEMVKLLHEIEVNMQVASLAMLSEELLPNASSSGLLCHATQCRSQYPIPISEYFRKGVHRGGSLSFRTAATRGPSHASMHAAIHPLIRQSPMGAVWERADACAWRSRGVHTSHTQVMHSGEVAYTPIWPQNLNSPE